MKDVHQTNSQFKSGQLLDGLIKASELVTPLMWRLAPSLWIIYAQPVIQI